MALQLKVVTLALKRLSNRAPDAIACVVSDFLVSDLPLSKAIALSAVGSVDLVDFVWLRSLRAAESSRWTVAKLLQSDANYHQLQFSLALVQAVRRTDLSLVQWVLRHFSACPVNKQVIEEAARGGHLWALQLLEEDSSHAGIEWGDESLIEAAREGHWHVVHWLHQRVGTPHEDFYSVADYALKRSNLEQLKWAMAHGSDILGSVPIECGEEQRAACWETVRYLLALKHWIAPYLLEWALELAAKLDDLEFTRWLLTRYVIGEMAGRVILAPALAAAGRYGRTEVLEVLLAHLTDLHLPHDPSKVMFEAAKYGKLDAVRWLVEHYSGSSDVDLFPGLPRQPVAPNTTDPVTVMDIAASHGHLDVLKYLHQDGDTHSNRRQCTDAAMNVASSNGHLEAVKWLLVNGNEGSTTFAMDNAAANGHLAVVKWLHANRYDGCTADAMDSAASQYFRVSFCCGDPDKPRQCYEPNSFVKNQLLVMQWLHANGIERSTTRAMDGAAANGNFEMVKWLHENTTAGCSQSAMHYAAGRGRLDIVTWLHEIRSEVCTASAMVFAAAGGHLDVLKYLHANTSERCPTRALDLAVHGDLDVLAWLLENRPKGTMSKEVNDIAHGHLKVVQWLVQHCEGLNIVSAMERAIVCNEPEIVCYLDAQRTDRSVTVGEMQAHLHDSSPLSLS